MKSHVLPAAVLALFGVCTASAQSISTIAGGGSSDGRPATLVVAGSVSGLAADRQGHIYFADRRESKVKRVDALTGLITTVAGNGSTNFSGDGGPAHLASMDVKDIAFDRDGALLIAGNARIRRLDLTTKVITTLFKGGTTDEGPATQARLNPRSLAVASNGDLYFAEDTTPRIRMIVRSSEMLRTVVREDEWLLYLHGAVLGFGAGLLHLAIFG